jgi:hypothetical protein
MQNTCSLANYKRKMWISSHAHNIANKCQLTFLAAAALVRFCGGAACRMAAVVDERRLPFSRPQLEV